MEGGALATSRACADTLVVHPLSRALVLVVERVHAQEKEKRNAGAQNARHRSRVERVHGLTSSGYNCHKTKPFVCAPRSVFGAFSHEHAMVRACLTPSRPKNPRSPRLFAAPTPPRPG